MTSHGNVMSFVDQDLRTYTSGNPEGTCIFLLTDGEENEDERFSTVLPGVVSDGIRVDTLLFG